MENNNSKFKSDFEKRLIKFSLNLIKFCNLLNKDRNYWVISDQLLRAGTSIGANVIEAKGSSSKREFVRFFEIALKSAYETQYWLILVRESNADFSKQSIILLSEAVELAKIISSSVLTMKGKKKY